MKTRFFFYIIINIFFLASCKYRGKKTIHTKEISPSKYEKIIDYINSKSITSYYDQKKVVIGSSFDNTNTLGVFEILYHDNKKNLIKLYKQSSNSLQEKNEILNQYKKRAFFFEKKYLDKIPKKHIEGLAVDWEYDIKPPCIIFVFNLKNGKWRFSESININSYDEYENILNSNINTLITNIKSAELFGKYHLTQDKGKIDEFSSIIIGYNIEIKKDSSFFSGQGYQTNFHDLCTVKQVKDTLELYYRSTIQGTNYNKNEEQPLVKLYKKGNYYYAKSPVISVDGKVNIEVRLEKE